LNEEAFFAYFENANGLQFLKITLTFEKIASKIHPDGEEK
jgi:hypothetical protein